MHELAIAQSIVKAVVKEKKEKRLSSISTVGLRIGSLSGVLPDALRFSFAVAVEGTVLADARLEIEHVPAEGRCRCCAADVRLAEGSFLCPICCSGSVDLRNGQELEIAYIEGESRGQADESQVGVV